MANLLAVLLDCLEQAWQITLNCLHINCYEGLKPDYSSAMGVPHNGASIYARNALLHASCFPVQQT